MRRPQLPPGTPPPSSTAPLRRDFEAVTERLLDITSRFYAVVDYPDEDIEDIQPQEIRRALRECDATLSRLLDTCSRGNGAEKRRGHCHCGSAQRRQVLPS